MNKKQKKDYFDEFPLDDYEKELEEFLEKGKFVPVKNFEKRKKDLQEAAKNFFVRLAVLSYKPFEQCCIPKHYDLDQKEQLLLVLWLLRL